MKFLARACSAVSSAILLIGIALVLLGCQGNISTPSMVATASPLPPRNFTDTPPVSPTSSTLPTLTSTPLPAPANPTVSNPPLQTTPAPMETRSPGDGESQTWHEPRPSNSNALALTVVPTAPNPQALALTVVPTAPNPQAPALTVVPTAPNPQALAGNPAQPFNEKDLYIHVPPQAKQQQPLRILLVLHGMGARGDSFAQSLISEADRYNWVVVAPTMPYRDYMDLSQLMDDDLKISQMLNQLLDSLPSRLNLKLRQHVLVYGFSRGAQLAHRFALFHPERVESIVTMSAGSYTLPSTQSKEQTLLPFPYGIGDLEKFLGHPLDWESYKRISFWVAVGERDTQPSDVPRAFDPYLGQTRVERAAAFAKSLSALGIDSHLVIFPNTGHEVTPEMRKSGMQFLRDDEVADHWDD